MPPGATHSQTLTHVNAGKVFRADTSLPLDTFLQRRGGAVDSQERNASDGTCAARSVRIGCMLVCMHRFWLDPGASTWKAPPLSECWQRAASPLPAIARRGRPGTELDDLACITRRNFLKPRPPRPPLHAAGPLPGRDSRHQGWGKILACSGSTGYPSGCVSRLGAS